MVVSFEENRRTALEFFAGIGLARAGMNRSDVATICLGNSNTGRLNS